MLRLNMNLLDYDTPIAEFSMWRCYDGSSYLGRFHTFSNYYFGRSRDRSYKNLVPIKIVIDLCTTKRVGRSGFYGVVGVAEGGF
jgi:hypothetical protein